ncbi:nucleotidyltransferase domain-containing protein [Sunxiuqinia indica]|uniref:nucleotidyltransferase domain-containing protein n=1 Tax=Sunxiuqinia indica TaxID=2692584 RepID=UPI00135C3187|nr:nucleotidyltransferase family protein [Sunxiuqinia indica]
MNKKELFYFVGKCLTIQKHSDFRDELIRKVDQVDWYDFVSLCSDHLVMPAIYVRFDKANVLGYLPDELVDHLRQIYEMNTGRNRKILTQVSEITALLNKENIKPTFLKGVAYILDDVYSDVGERMMNDIDFLVDERDYLKCAGLLKSKGYQQEEETPGYIDVADSKHYPRLFHPEWGAAVEIHRIPVDQAYLNQFNSSLIDREKVFAKKLLGCYVPSDKHKLVHSFIHSQLSNEGHLYGMISLRGLCDLSKLAERYSLNEALSFIKPKHKAIAYFALADRILGEERAFFEHRNISYSILKTKHILGIRFKIFRTIFRSLIFFSQRIIGGYILLPISAIFIKRKREYLMRRLRDDSWLKNHRQIWGQFFNRRL